MAADAVAVDGQQAAAPSSDAHATSEANGTLTNGVHDHDEQTETAAEDAAQATHEVFQLTVKLPHAPGETFITVTTQEQVQDVRQTVVDSPHTFQYSCFHLEHKGKRVNDFVELSEVEGIVEDPVLVLVEDPYTESQARMHVVRVRELIGAAGDRTDLITGIEAGMSLCDSIDLPSSHADQDATSSPIADYDLNAPGKVSSLLPKARDAAPKTLKTLSLAAWNPPPYHLRMRGHLLYLLVTTNEGEQYYITSAITGFFVNKSTNSKFDPSPRSSPKAFAAHSLITLLGEVSPSFDASFRKLQEYNGQRDPLASYTVTNCIPAAPWLVSHSATQQHQSDLARTQESFLLMGETSETLRDWNEDFQSTKELPKETVQERVFRERLMAKVFTEYNEVAVRGAVLVARGEVQPLNPTEAKDAQIFVYNNVFYSFGADGVGTFAIDGGDEAARVAVGKDVQGVKNVNQLDVDGLFTPGTVVVDYLGKRIVGQSIVPGIFKQREPGEHQIDYGGVEGKDVIASLESFVEPFSQLSKAMRVKKHAVWDKELKKHELEASVETKGLVGTDARKYVLDLYRVTPLDVAWLEKYRTEDQEEAQRYPHRMTVLRPELVESYRVMKLREYIGAQLEKKRAESGNDASSSVKGEQTEPVKTEEPTQDVDEAKIDDDANGTDEAKPAAQRETVDVSGFSFALNPDVFSGQQPQTDDEKAEWAEDEAAVRAVCTYLTNDVIPRLIADIKEGEAAFPMDGQSLTRELHKRGVNLRYLGDLSKICEKESQDKRMVALNQLVKQEMVSRAFKHFVNAQLRGLPPCFAQAAVAHLLNCLLGGAAQPNPKADIDAELKSMYPDVALDFAQVTPGSLAAEIKRQIALRFRITTDGELVEAGRELQLLREVCMKLGFQIEAKEYAFTKDALAASAGRPSTPQSTGVQTPTENGANGTNSSSNKKKKKKQQQTSDAPAKATTPVSAGPPATFAPENIFNIVPIVKDAAPRSVVAEEALDAGRMSIQQDQKELGQELLLESLSLHEQIYGVLHPEVARVYYALSTIYYKLNEKAAAVDLARKAVIVSERTLGVDNAETVLAYLNLSLFEHANDNTKDALAFVRHALDLWKIVYGPRHPDSITTINNAAVMLQQLKQFHESRLWFESSLELCEEISGKQAIATATLLFQLAQALALDQDSKSAVGKMRESYTIFKTELGADNQNTKEAESWLETLTQAAVNQAKQAHLIANRKILLRNGKTPRLPVGTKPQPPATQQAPDAIAPASSARGQVDQRSVDELLKYINGDGGKQATPKKKKASNPMRRQQAV